MSGFFPGGKVAMRKSNQLAFHFLLTQFAVLASTLWLHRAARGDLG